MNMYVNGNGHYPFKSNKYYGDSVLYIPDMDGATATLSAYGVELEGGTLQSNTQKIIEHGKQAKLSIEVSNFSTPFTIVIKAK